MQKKLRQNFAASSCGAKVVASNAEAENINYLLNGNPDEYLLSPCKAKKWLVVNVFLSFFFFFRQFYGVADLCLYLVLSSIGGGK